MQWVEHLQLVARGSDRMIELGRQREAIYETGVDAKLSELGRRVVILGRRVAHSTEAVASLSALAEEVRSYATRWPTLSSDAILASMHASWSRTISRAIINETRAGKAASRSLRRAVLESELESELEAGLAAAESVTAESVTAESVTGRD